MRRLDASLRWHDDVVVGSVKQLNAFPLIMLLIVVIGMIYWFSGLR